MLTHVIKSINWVDVGLLFVLVRMIFVGVQNGFISEFFKSLGIVAAVFVSLHYYSFLAAWVASKTHFSWGYWELVICAGLWFSASWFFKLMGDGISMLFKVETNHQGFDKYAAGVVAVGRGILVCSLAIFLFLLSHYKPLVRTTFKSYSYKIAGRADVMTYSFIYKNLVNKFFTGEHYNPAPAQAVKPEVNL